MTIVQAMGTQKMAREQAIIKDLKAVESLGLCVRHLFGQDGNADPERDDRAAGVCWAADDGSSGMRWTCSSQSAPVSALRCDPDQRLPAIVDGPGAGMRRPDRKCAPAGNGQSRRAFGKEDIPKELMPRLEELPFDSDQEADEHESIALHGVPTVLAKGAVDVLLTRTDRYPGASGAREVPVRSRSNVTVQRDPGGESSGFPRHGLASPGLCL